MGWKTFPVFYLTFLSVAFNWEWFIVCPDPVFVDNPWFLCWRKRIRQKATRLGAEMIRKKLISQWCRNDHWTLMNSGGRGGGEEGRRGGDGWDAYCGTNCTIHRSSLIDLHASYCTKKKYWLPLMTFCLSAQKIYSVCVQKTQPVCMFRKYIICAWSDNNFLCVCSANLFCVCWKANFACAENVFCSSPAIPLRNGGFA